MSKIIKFGNILEYRIHAISTSTVWVVAGMIFLMTLLTFSDVIGRYFLNHPIQGAQDVTESMMVFIIFLAAGYSVYKKSQIRINVLIDHFPNRSRKGFYIFATFIAAGTISLVVWQLGMRAIDLLVHPGPETAIIHLPRGPFILIAAIGAFIMCLEFWIEFAHSITQRDEN